MFYSVSQNKMPMILHVLLCVWSTEEVRRDGGTISELKPCIAEQAELTSVPSFEPNDGGLFHSKGMAFSLYRHPKASPWAYLAVS
jgi:hypothetical protein